MRILSSDKAYYDIEDLDRCNCILDNENLKKDYPESAFISSEIIGIEEINDFEIKGTNSIKRRKLKLRDLFEKHETLLIYEAAKLIGVTPKTAAQYMKELAKEGLIERVTPTPSVRTHYYILRKKS